MKILQPICFQVCLFWIRVTKRLCNWLQWVGGNHNHKKENCQTFISVITARQVIRSSQRKQLWFYWTKFSRISKTNLKGDPVANDSRLAGTRTKDQWLVWFAVGERCKASGERPGSATTVSHLFSHTVWLCIKAQDSAVRVCVGVV